MIYYTEEQVQKMLDEAIRASRKETLQEVYKMSGAGSTSEYIPNPGLGKLLKSIIEKETPLEKIRKEYTEAIKPPSIVMIREGYDSPVHPTPSPSGIPWGWCAVGAIIGFVLAALWWV